MVNVRVWAFSIALALATAANASPQFSNIYTIGDSNSDIGVRYALTHGTPGAPYWQGRHSNGPVAVEYLYQALGIPETAGGNNLAVGGALTDKGNVDRQLNAMDTGMQSQLQQLLAKAPQGKLDSKALYFIWGGGNDLKNCIATCGEETQMKIASNIHEILNALQAHGARYFFVVNQYGFSNEPFDHLLDKELTGKIDPPAKLILFDALAVLKNIRQHPDQFGFNFSKPADRCIDGGPGSRGVQACETPDEHVFWDRQNHLTAKAQKILGEAMVQALNAAFQ
jgi:phospholipase/lecithinase/hemolysin